MRLAILLAALLTFGASANAASPARTGAPQDTQPRQCVDAAGRAAWCGEDPSDPHECVAADRYDACPNDPHCFEADGRRIACLRPVVRLDDRMSRILRTPIPYPSVAATLDGLHRRHLLFSLENGWTIAQDVNAQTLFQPMWSFAPPGHPAYPAVVRRQVAGNPADAWSIAMVVRCEGSKPACDEFVRGFERLNARALADIRRTRRMVLGASHP